MLLTALYRGHATLDDLVTDGKLSVKVQEALAANHKAVETEYYAFAIYALQKYPEYVTKVIKRQELLRTPERITGKGSTSVSAAATGGLAKKLDFSSAKKEPSAEETKPSTSSSNKAAVASDAVLTKRNVAPAPVPTETPASSSANPVSVSPKSANTTTSSSQPLMFVLLALVAAWAIYAYIFASRTPVARLR